MSADELDGSEVDSSSGDEDFVPDKTESPPAPKAPREGAKRARQPTQPITSTASEGEEEVDLEASSDEEEDVEMKSATSSSDGDDEDNDDEDDEFVSEDRDADSRQSASVFDSEPRPEFLVSASGKERPMKGHVVLRTGTVYPGSDIKQAMASHSIPKSLAVLKKPQPGGHWIFAVAMDVATGRHFYPVPKAWVIKLSGLPKKELVRLQLDRDYDFKDSRGIFAVQNGVSYIFPEVWHKETERKRKEQPTSLPVVDEEDEPVEPQPSVEAKEPPAAHAKRPAKKEKAPTKTGAAVKHAKATEVKSKSEPARKRKTASEAAKSKKRIKPILVCDEPVPEPEPEPDPERVDSVVVEKIAENVIDAVSDPGPPSPFHGMSGRVKVELELDLPAFTIFARNWNASK